MKRKAVILKLVVIKNLNVKMKCVEQVEFINLSFFNDEFCELQIMNKYFKRNCLNQDIYWCTLISQLKLI